MEPALFLIAILASQGQSEAAERAASAYIQQTQLDTMLDRYQRRIVSEETRRLVGDAALVGKILIERRVTVKCRFR